MSRLNSYAWSSTTPSTDPSQKSNSSSETYSPIPVDRDGWPICEAQRPVWPRVKCEVCNSKTALQYLPATYLSARWTKYMTDVNGLLAVCHHCFSEVRKAEGQIKGYKTVKGKTRQYVEEELFGDNPNW